MTSIASSSDALFLPTGDAAQPIERRLIDRTSAALALTDTAGRITYVNPAFLSLWDFEDAGQVLGRALSDGLWLDPEDARAAFDSALTNGLWQGHLMARATTGLPRPTRLSFAVLADDVGRSEGVLLTLHEIDAQRTGGNARDGRHTILDDICERQAECERTRTEALMRLTLDTYPGPVACVDKDMRYVYVNNRFAQAVGVPAENIVGRSADDVLDEQGRSQRWQAHRRLLAGESRIDLERRYVDREGRERVVWVQYRCSAGLAGDGGDLYFAFVLDITDLRQVQRRLATVTEDMGVGLWEATYPGGTFHCNDELLATLGCARADLSGDVQQWLTDRIAPADLAPRRSVMRALKSGRTSRAEVQTRVRHQQGHWVWLQEVVRNVPGGAGSGFARLVGLAQDISALKSREAALEELTQHLEARIEQRTQALDDARREAERANAAKSEFLSQMSHELRTPLNAMLGFGQLLEMSQLKAVDAEHLQEVMRAGRHLVHLIDEILDLATVEAGRTPIERASVALRPLVDQCVRLLGPLAQAAGVALEVEDLPRGAAVEGDAARLKQVLLNLLSNGIKYNRPRGRVRISLHHCADDAKRWELRVADSGAGLTGEQIDRLFQPFERLDAARTGIEGTGIGLALARRLTELMDGRLDVQSVPGHGSTFAVRLVRAAPPGNAAAGLASERPYQCAGHATSPAKRYRVLYVEDNEANRRLMAQLLAERAELEPRTAATAAEARAVTAGYRPHLLLIDIQLPDADGNKLLGELRSQGLSCPAIAVSANAMPADVSRGLAAGFDHYLTKPLDLERVLRVIDDVLHPARPTPGAGRDGRHTAVRAPGAVAMQTGGGEPHGFGGQ